MSGAAFFRQPAPRGGDNGRMTDQELLARLILHYGRAGARGRLNLDLDSGFVTAGEVLASPALRERYRVMAGEEIRHRASGDLELAARVGVRILTPADPGWPLQAGGPLRGTGVLFARGVAPAPGSPADRVRIVGSRAASRWAVELASSCAAALAVDEGRAGGAGARIVSGGALGVDAAAHEGALRGGGITWVFLGSGVLAPYPAGNRGLFERVIAAGGCLFSANHLYGKPDQGYFVQRNAFMAACAGATVVVEASSISGALHTARFSLEAGRPVWAHAGSTGCNRLLLEGARPFREPDGLVAEIAKNAKGDVPSAGKTENPLHGGLFPEEIAARTQNTLTEVFQRLQIGELNGEVVRLPGGRYLNLRNPEWS